MFTYTDNLVAVYKKTIITGNVYDVYFEKFIDT